MLSLEDGKVLLKLAKKSVTSYFTGEPIDVDESIKKKFSHNQGVFVTLHKHGELRGCIGFPEPVMALWKAITLAAKAAAFEDPRFVPVQQTELDEIVFEISVLTIPEEIKVKEPKDYLKEIKIGRDGLIIRGRFGSGLLLPQVAPEWGWTQLEFLDNVCQKAGLPIHAWQDLGNKIFRFQAQIFTEEKPNGKIVKKKE
jgi:uncharacterized protein (TIGR00296 family)